MFLLAILSFSKHNLLTTDCAAIEYSFKSAQSTYHHQSQLRPIQTNSVFFSGYKLHCRRKIALLIQMRMIGCAPPLPKTYTFAHPYFRVYSPPSARPGTAMMPTQAPHCQEYMIRHWNVGQRRISMGAHEISCPEPSHISSFTKGPPLWGYIRWAPLCSSFHTVHHGISPDLTSRTMLPCVYLASVFFQLPRHDTSEKHMNEGCLPRISQTLDDPNQPPHLQISSINNM